MIKAIAFTMYPVADLARSRRFYEETLGLTKTRDFGDSWVEYDLGPATFAISTYGKPSSDGPGIAFEVEDLDVALERLKATGISLEGEVIDTPVCRIAMFKDPDGNSLIFHKCKEGHS